MYLIGTPGHLVFVELDSAGKQGTTTEVCTVRTSGTCRARKTTQHRSDPLYAGRHQHFRTAQWRASHLDDLSILCIP